MHNSQSVLDRTTTQNVNRQFQNRQTYRKVWAVVFALIAAGLIAFGITGLCGLHGVGTVGCSVALGVSVIPIALVVRVIVVVRLNAFQRRRRLREQEMCSAPATPSRAREDAEFKATSEQCRQ